MRWALTQRLPSEGNDAIIGPMSSGWPTRPSAVMSATRLFTSGLSRTMPPLNQEPGGGPRQRFAAGRVRVNLGIGACTGLWTSFSTVHAIVSARAVSDDQLSREILKTVSQPLKDPLRKGTSAMAHR